MLRQVLCLLGLPLLLGLLGHLPYRADHCFLVDQELPRLQECLPFLRHPQVPGHRESPHLLQVLSIR